MPGRTRKQRRHTIEKFQERYGRQVNKAQIQSMSNLITACDNPHFKGKAIFFDRKSKRFTRWFVWFENCWFPVVYDKHLKTIATVLPSGSLSPIPAPLALS